MDVDKITPTDDQVLVRPEGAYYGGEQASGLFVPVEDGTVDREAPEIGTVLAVGPGRLDIVKRRAGNVRAVYTVRVPMEVVEGDRVLFSRYAGADLGTTREWLQMIRQSEILARVVD